MALIRNLIWEIGMAVLLGGVILFAVYKVADSAKPSGAYFNSTSGNFLLSNGSAVASADSPATFWGSAGLNEFTSNTSLIGLVIVIGLIAGVLAYTKFIKS